jgi:hypothetical protein
LHRDVIYVPSSNKNLIISGLNKDGLNVILDMANVPFGVIMLGIAYLHDKLYLLSLREKVNYVCDVNENFVIVFE